MCIRDRYMGEKPDYNYLRKLFKELFLREAYEFDFVYDWILLPMSVKYPTLRGRFPANLELNLDEDDDNLTEFDDEEEKSILAEDTPINPNPLQTVITPKPKDLNVIYKDHEAAHNKVAAVNKSPGVIPDKNSGKNTQAAPPVYHPQQRPQPTQPTKKDDCALF
eukprot:TRINITY_DN5535_c0_g1_i6.p1 TRINITY_DN5535_c0_g1~~TRINITY_DN5535_c0_g1_i6.p1  ORF type:complete len:164 (+),score=50.73 TRINITY_DN5535_c0_g1_i6:64-555(+)